MLVARHFNDRMSHKGDTMTITDAETRELTASLEELHDDLEEYNYLDTELTDMIDAKDNINDCITAVTSESYKPTTAKYIIESYNLSVESIGLEELSVESVDEGTKFKEAFKTLMGIILATFNKIVAAIKKIFINITNSTVIYSQMIKRLSSKIMTLPASNPISDFNSSDTLKVFKRFGTIIQTNTRTLTVKDVMRNINDVLEDISSPKITINAGKRIVDIINVTVTHSADYDKLDEDGQEIIDTEIDEINSGVNSRKLKEHFNNMLEGYNDAETKHSACIEYYGTTCKGIIVRDGAIQYTEAYKNLGATELYGVFCTKTGKEEMTSDITVTHLRGFMRDLNNMDRNYSNFKKAIDNSIILCDVMLAHIMVTNVNAMEHSEVKKLDYSMRIVNQYTRTVPKLGNANIINYFNFLKNMYWLASTCFDNVSKPETVKVGYNG